jgi:hypothetical protein
VVLQNVRVIPIWRAAACQSIRLWQSGSSVTIPPLTWRHSCLAVVVVLSTDFVRKRHPMKELAQVMAQRRSGSIQRICPVLIGITCEDCDVVSLEADGRDLGVDLRQLLTVTGIRDDQVHYSARQKHALCANVILAQTITARKVFSVHLQTSFRPQMCTEGSCRHEATSASWRRRQ